MSLLLTKPGDKFGVIETSITLRESPTAQQLNQPDINHEIQGVNSIVRHDMIQKQNPSTLATVSLKDGSYHIDSHRVVPYYCTAICLTRATHLYPLTMLACGAECNETNISSMTR